MQSKLSHFLITLYPTILDIKPVFYYILLIRTQEEQDMALTVQLHGEQWVAYERLCDELITDYVTREHHRPDLANELGAAQPRISPTSQRISVCLMTGTRIPKGTDAVKLQTTNTPRVIILGIVRDLPTFLEMLNLNSMDEVRAHRRMVEEEAASPS